MELDAFSNSHDPVPLNRLSQDTELARAVQSVLIDLGILDPPIDGAVGSLTGLALKVFNKLNGLSLEETHFHPEQARLLSTAKAEILLPIVYGDDLASRLTRAMISRGDFYCRVDGAVNIVYVEGMDVDGTANANAQNQFNDIRTVVTLVNGRPRLLGVWEATTEPGNHYTLNPVPEARSKGAARIAFGQYRAWTVGRHSDHEALVQHGGKVTVYRDFNKDHEREGDKTETGFLGINQHWGYDYPTTDINRASAGCLVGRTKAGHRQFMGIVKSDQRYTVNNGYRYWTSIFPANQIT